MDGPVTLNRAELARAMGVTEPTVDRWRHDGCPIAFKGSNGRAYAFDLAAVKAWREGVDAAAAAEQARKDALIAQAELDLIGGGAAGDSGEVLTAKNRKAALEAELLQNKLRRERAELVPAADVEAQFREVFGTLSRSLAALPDIMARRLDWDVEATAVFEEALEDARAAMARALMGADGE